MKRSDSKELREFRAWLKTYLLETADPRAQFALGYRRAQSNYVDDNLIQDFTGYSPEFVKGYKAGIRDARLGKFNQAVTKILTAIGDFMGQWNVGNRSRKY